MRLQICVVVRLIHIAYEAEDDDDNGDDDDGGDDDVRDFVWFFRVSFLYSAVQMVHGTHPWHNIHISSVWEFKQITESEFILVLVFVLSFFGWSCCGLD